MMPNYTDDDGDTIIDDDLSTFGDDEERLSTTNILTSSQSAGLGPVTRNNLRHFFTRVTLHNTSSSLIYNKLRCEVTKNDKLYIRC